MKWKKMINQIKLIDKKIFLNDKLDIFIISILKIKVIIIKKYF